MKKLYQIPGDSKIYLVFLPACINQALCHSKINYIFLSSGINKALCEGEVDQVLSATLGYLFLSLLKVDKIFESSLIDQTLSGSVDDEFANVLTTKFQTFFCNF